MDAQPVGAFFHGSAQFAGFHGHGGNAVGFFDTPAGDVAQRGRPVGKQGHDRQCHGGVWNVVAIHINGFKGPLTLRVLVLSPAHFQPIGAAGNCSAHLSRRVHEANVALNRVRAHALNANALLASQRPQGNEITGR